VAATWSALGAPAVPAADGVPDEAPELDLPHAGIKTRRQAQTRAK
jgi:hypothetical protein